jgi:hypothetical protein
MTQTLPFTRIALVNSSGSGWTFSPTPKAHLSLPSIHLPQPNPTLVPPKTIFFLPTHHSKSFYLSPKDYALLGVKSSFLGPTFSLGPFPHGHIFSSRNVFSLALLLRVDFTKTEILPKSKFSYWNWLIKFFSTENLVIEIGFFKDWANYMFHRFLLSFLEVLKALYLWRLYMGNIFEVN